MDTQTPLPPKPVRPLLSWQAPAGVHHQRSPRWYLVAGLFVGLCALYSIWTGSWSFTLVIVLLTGVYAYVHRHPPAIKDVHVTGYGLQLDDDFTPWSECTSFWLLQGHGYVELHVARHRRVHREITVQTGPTDITRLRQVLSEFIPERAEHRERTLDMIIRILKI